MYRCQKCGVQASEGKPANFIYTYREKEYPPRFRKSENQWGREESEMIDPGGTGKEISSQQMVCHSCWEEAQQK